MASLSPHVHNAGMNVLVICSDTFRYDHLGFLRRHPVSTPNLDALASQSACFTDFHLCSFPTLVNRIEVFTGRYTFPLIDWGPLPYQFPVLSEVFKRHGFATALIADNPHLMRNGFGFGRGYDTCINIPGQAHDRFITTGPMHEITCPREKLEPDDKRLDRYRHNRAWYHQQNTNTTQRVFEEATNFLNAAPEKFFLWIDAFDPHEPWDAPEVFQQPYPLNGADKVFWPHSGPADRYSEAEIENMRAFYRAEVSQIDHHVGRLLAFLREKKIFDTTAILFCSDHGYYFGEHGLLGKPPKGNPPKQSIASSTIIYEELGQIPLLLRHPQGLAAGQTIPGLCQPPDLFATALDLAGIPPVPWTQGNSLAKRLISLAPGSAGGSSRDHQPPAPPDKPPAEPGADSQSFAVGGCHPRRNNPSCLTVWTDEWILIYNPRKGLAGSELFHRPTDPEQTQNVLTENFAIAKRHFDLLTQWLDQLNVPAARQAQLLHAQPAPRFSKLRYRLWMLKNRFTYYKHRLTYRST
ncbi:MAG: sulfatase [Phycisphaerales bacterium]|nr:sulfatase [Phycisphaerales bacterium]